MSWSLPVHRLRSWFSLRPRFWLFVGAVVALLLIVRIALPYVICRAINQRLANVEGYAGRVNDVDLQLFRGAYRIDRVTIKKREQGRLESFFSAETIDFSLAWGELFHGRFVSDILLVAPQLQLTHSNQPVDASAEGRQWQDVIQDIFPIEITHLEIRRGLLGYVDSTSTPRVNISLRELDAVATGLRNQPTDESGPFPASLKATGTTIGGGRFDLSVRGDPLAAQPRFILKLDLQDVELVALNDFLEAYANIDVSAGEFQLYVEIKASDGRFEGYAKPFLDHVSFKNLSDDAKGPLRRMWESLVSGVSSIVKNDERDQIGTRIPFAGEFGQTDVGIWSTIVHLVRHGFGRALVEGWDSEPNPLLKPRPDNSPEDEKPRPKPGRVSH